MPLYALDSSTWFPPVEEAMEDGLLAIGGDLSQQRLLAAYRKGIFPWYDGDVPLWWCPNPRFILLPADIRVSKSMQVLIKRQAFRFSINEAFGQVIHACRTSRRREQDGTWINDDIEIAYTNLHKDGYAFSAEAWQNNELAGGLYGIRLGNIFFGESMFSRVSNASKYAFIQFANNLQQQGVCLIDCQVYTPHLESLGAKMITRAEFCEILRNNI
ncbi:leucyl/phenylalanyl-tRNA--protein transferase [Foetidibacter luteolus]|uniref:leucyl/phenylalanyl-tRNA--protein transferase n=1 Tax=Foetidibacter luteolus TaxID=2608880 RepID=UPI00129A3949|nr:leucyl/phenylalanyl-tRNA--protein transferase [Foetidibacter luteolus]